jgi:hypothetical protein
MNFSALGMSCQLVLSDVVPTLDYREGICSMGLPCHSVGPPFYVCSLFCQNNGRFTPEHCKVLKQDQQDL